MDGAAHATRGQTPAEIPPRSASRSQPDCATCQVWLGGYVDADGEPVYARDTLIAYAASSGFEMRHEQVL